jgi:hypothetical protein
MEIQGVVPSMSLIVTPQLEATLSRQDLKVSLKAFALSVRSDFQTILDPSVSPWLYHAIVGTQASSVLITCPC